MKFKNVKSSDLTSGITQVAGVGVGLMLPNAIGNAYAKVSDDAVATDDQNKKKMIVNGASLLLGTYGALAIDDKDTLGAILKAVSLGLAGGGVKGLAGHFLKTEVAKTNPETIQGRMLRGGLGCACDSKPTYYLQRPRLRIPMPMPSFPTMESEKANVLDTFQFN